MKRLIKLLYVGQIQASKYLNSLTLKRHLIKETFRQPNIKEAFRRAGQTDLTVQRAYI